MSGLTSGKITIPSLLARKNVGPKIVCLTAYDYPTARILDEHGVDLILVGDSLGMVVLGYENTIPVTMEDMLHHARAVTRGVQRALVVGDMPYFSFHLGPEETVRNASRFLKEAGAAAVKIEGASPKRLKIVEALVEAEIPVMGHVGLTPQSIHPLGRFRVVGTGAAESEKIVKDAQNLDRAGVFAIVIESVPMEIAAMITERVKVPTIGIGAGPACDGQVLVFHDLVGYSTGYLPKFVKKYADLAGTIGKAVDAYATEVRSGQFPDDATSYHLKPEVALEVLPGGEGASGAGRSSSPRPADGKNEGPVAKERIGKPSAKRLRAHGAPRLPLIRTGSRRKPS